VTVIGHRVPADHGERGARVVELEEQVAKVVRELDHASRQRTKRIGVSVLE
jgi:hypothetical protein